MRDVLPTAASPTRQTFIFIRRTSMVRPCAPAFTRPTAYKRAENVIKPEIDSRIVRPMAGRETRRLRPRPNSTYPRCALWGVETFDVRRVLGEGAREAVEDPRRGRRNEVAARPPRTGARGEARAHRPASATD